MPDRAILTGGTVFVIDDDPSLTSATLGEAQHGYASMPVIGMKTHASRAFASSKLRSTSCDG